MSAGGQSDLSRAAPGFPTEHDVLTRVLLKHARDAFGSAERIRDGWREPGFRAPPDPARAVEEYDALVTLLEATDVRIEWLPADDTGLDSIYVHDPFVMVGGEAVLGRPAKAIRAPEVDACRRRLDALGVPVRGAIEPPGHLEGGDVVGLSPGLVAVGNGYRTDAGGVRQLETMLGDEIEVVEVPLPHWRGPGEVLHLMSLLSPVDRDLAVAYPPLLPVPFLRRLQELGVELVEVPEDEFETLGCNVLALGPRHCLMLEGNPRTRAGLEAAGARVEVFPGEEICRKGDGGPTCLTRPLERLP